MSNIAQIGDYRGPWTAAPVVCRCCSTRWVAVWPKGANPRALKCPGCGKCRSQLDNIVPFRRRP